MLISGLATGAGDISSRPGALTLFMLFDVVLELPAIVLLLAALVRLDVARNLPDAAFLSSRCRLLLGLMFWFSITPFSPLSLPARFVIQFGNSGLKLLENKAEFQFSHSLFCFPIQTQY